MWQLLTWAIISSIAGPAHRAQGSQQVGGRLQVSRRQPEAWAAFGHQHIQPNLQSAPVKALQFKPSANGTQMYF